MKDVFGNIEDVSIDIAEVVSTELFKKYWDITKSQIEDCKICEFRSICTDCRAFTNTYGKPSKCSYNPRTKVWEK
jgi:radical SAM protein with 4Fe4S-binding SPASM domain